MSSSEFSSRGFESMPSIYPDSQLVGEFSTWDDDVLADRVLEYSQFLQRKDLMPRARAESERILQHLMFEYLYRENLLQGVVILDNTVA